MLATSRRVAKNKPGHTSIVSSVGSYEVIRLAQEAQHTALHFHGIVLKFDSCVIGLAIVGIIDRALPLLGTCRLHADQNGEADKRARAQREVGVLTVDFWLSIDLADGL